MERPIESFDEATNDQDELKRKWIEEIKERYPELSQMDQVIDIIIDAYFRDPDGFHSEVKKLQEAVSEMQVDHDEMVIETTAQVLRPGTKEHDEYLNMIEAANQVQQKDETNNIQDDAEADHID